MALKEDKNKVNKYGGTNFVVAPILGKGAGCFGVRGNLAKGELKEGLALHSQRSKAIS